jgi:hypothetical protein
VKNCSLDGEANVKKRVAHLVQPTFTFLGNPVPNAWSAALVVGTCCEPGLSLSVMLNVGNKLACVIVT